MIWRDVLLADLFGSNLSNGCLVSAPERSSPMRMVVSDDNGKAVGRTAKVKGNSPEHTLQEAIDCLDGSDNQSGRWLPTKPVRTRCQRQADAFAEQRVQLSC
jgi:hypothetical protein